MKTFHKAGAVAQMVEQQLLSAISKESSYKSPDLWVTGSKYEVFANTKKIK